MSKSDEELFSEVLYNTGVLLPVSTESKGGKVSSMCRLAPGKDKEWPPLAEKILKAVDALGAEAHVCRRYVLREGSMVYGIHVSVEAKSAKQLKAALTSMQHSVGSINAAPVTAPGAPVVKEVYPAMSYAEYRKYTSATPRALTDPAKVDPPPPGFTYQSKRVQTSVGENGKVTIVDEVPLPHIHHEMNVPNSKGRGARQTGG
jgi:hypothetical protein